MLKILKFIKDIKGVFKLPKKKYYFGKIVYGTPYFNPINFSPTVLRMRKLILQDENKYQELCKSHPWSKERNRFVNMPIVTRNKYWIFKIFNMYFWIEIGYPIMIKQVELGWKWKYDSIRFEWSPSFQIYFFNWQFVILWNSPDGDDDDYYEQVLWYLYGSDKNIKKAIETWGWVDPKTKKSTWNDDYLVIPTDIRLLRKLKIKNISKIK